MAMTHRNLCEYGESPAALYKLWDDDLKKTMRRRQFCELAGTLSFLASLFAWKSGLETYWAFGILLGIYFTVNAVKMMIDESNINYLLHRWDLENALASFKGAQWP
jgi:hypothetical protein